MNLEHVTPRQRQITITVTKQIQERAKDHNSLCCFKEFHVDVDGVHIKLYTEPLKPTSDKVCNVKSMFHNVHTHLEELRLGGDEMPKLQLNLNRQLLDHPFIDRVREVLKEAAISAGFFVWELDQNSDSDSQDFEPFKKCTLVAHFFD